jgi:hypothetical protein
MIIDPRARHARLLAVLTLLSACKKDKPPPEDSGPSDTSTDTPSDTPVDTTDTPVDTTDTPVDTTDTTDTTDTPDTTGWPTIPSSVPGRDLLLQCLQTPQTPSRTPWAVQTSSGCIQVAEDAACPPPEQALPWAEGALRDGCFGGELACVTSFTGREELVRDTFSWLPDTGPTTPAPDVADICCYTFLWYADGSICGRPLVDDAGNAQFAPVVAREGWTEADVGEALPLDAARLWAKDAAAEHASIASFARLTLDLTAHAAPAHLLTGVAAAMADEVRHARDAYAIAARGRAPAGPGALKVPSTGTPSLAQLAADTVRDGIVNESIAAAIAAARLAAATDPQVRTALQAVVDDEARHAALAWEIVAWACAVGGETVLAAADAALSEALEAARRAPVDDEPTAPAYGACGPTAVREARRLAIAALASSGGLS